MVKRVSVLLLCSAILLGVCGCGNSKDNMKEDLIDKTTNSDNSTIESGTRKSPKLEESTLQKIKEQALAIENVENVKISVKERIVYIDADINNATSEYKQLIGLDILNLFNKDIIEYYDFYFSFPNCVGMKTNSDTISWNNCSD